MAAAREIIDAIARKKGHFTDSFHQRAVEEADQGRHELLRVIEGNIELREQVSRDLDMYETALLSPAHRITVD
jgi:histidinol-phosphate/aromatic aminotransferase/cobyric acid decarboxylase-like protein